MASNLPPVPFNAPMIDQRGLTTHVWSDFFKQLKFRVGGNISATNDELQALTANDAVTFARMQNIATDSLIGRDTAGIGDPEQISVGGGIEFTGLGGIQTSAFTGDVTKSAGGTATTIANGSVNFAKMLGSDWTKSAAASGYTKLPNGMYMQWGVTGIIASGTNTGVTFPTAFPTACLQVIVGIQGNSATITSTTGQWGSGSYTTAGFDLYNRTSSAYVFNYMAVGY